MATSNRKNTNLALAEFTKANQHCIPDTPRAYLQSGESLRRTGKPDLALSDYNQAIKH
ncbi:MAG UNVERIFIED_CONTAM: hypothetical protein LVR29_17480 [Microcystis novacekii LVE1205-3]